MTDEQTKTLLRTYEFLLIGFLGVGLILFSLCLAARSSWVTGLKRQTELVLDEAEPGQYFIGDFVRYDSAFAVNGAAFKLLAARGKTSPGSYAVIAKIVTIYGPSAAVFVLEEGKARFVGFSSLPRRVKAQFSSPLLFSQIAYWERKLPSILIKDEGAGL
jgi:hypothetical protein